MSNKMQELRKSVSAIKETQRLLIEQGQEVIEQKKTTENAIEGMSTDGDEILENIQHTAQEQAKNIANSYAQMIGEQHKQAIEKTDEKLQEGTEFQENVKENITVVNTETGNNDFNGVLEQARQELKNVENETNKIEEDMQKTKEELQQNNQRIHEELTS